MKKTSNLWIARDKSGELYIYAEKPERNGTVFYTRNVKFVNLYKSFPMLVSEMYPEVTWENSPKELIIKKDE